MGRLVAYVYWFCVLYRRCCQTSTNVFYQQHHATKLVVTHAVATLVDVVLGMNWTLTDISVTVGGSDKRAQSYKLHCAKKAFLAPFGPSFSESFPFCQNNINLDIEQYMKRHLITSKNLYHFMVSFHYRLSPTYT